MKRYKVVVPVSGGKDSQACLQLATEFYGSSVVVGLFCDTGYEHPITYSHIDWMKEFYNVKIYTVSSGDVEMQCYKHKRFPGGGARFCTEELKIWPAKRFYRDFAKAYGEIEVWYGMRSGESHERRKRYKEIVNNDLYPPHEVLRKFPKELEKLGVLFRLPIIDWSDSEVFDYLKENHNPLYDKGFSRVGCFPCLASGDGNKLKAFSYDETGMKHFNIVKDIENKIGKKIFTSKNLQYRETFKTFLSDYENNKKLSSCNDSDDPGCSFCSI